MISSPPSTDGHISLIMSIFSDHEKIKVVERLSGDDAQAYVDILNEVKIHIISPLKVY